jgi:hypothetical protein
MLSLITIFEITPLFFQGLQNNRICIIFPQTVLKKELITLKEVPPPQKVTRQKPAVQKSASHCAAHVRIANFSLSARKKVF